MHDDPTPVLREDRLYATDDRLVCGRVGCAGMTALYSGRTIGGAVVLPFDEVFAAMYAEEGMDPVCECGRVRWTDESEDHDG